ncbi:AraC family transcriptional regulator [Rhizobium chutanense]|uniref:AraC family transcriptional regulator n=1 Tax=Rhizobium chutanense TaxID=2035448 RepID=A0A2A6JAR5_9HYPH|nr:AraC family transcriptional regulator [Rhizobium chutanense]PDT03246.1 AraC family transcriptional regulator [Rhizobium chutanense]
MTSPLKSTMGEGSVRYIGNDADGLSAALSTAASPIKVQVTASKTISFHCEFVSAGSISFGLCSEEGDFRCKREADCGKFLLFIPLYGNADFSSHNQSYHSSPGHGFISDGAPQGDLHIYGSRQHLIMMLARNEVASRLSMMLGRLVGSNLDFRPDIDLTSGPGRILQKLAEATFSGLVRDAVLRQSPLVLSNLTSAMTNLILETVPHRFSEELARPAPAPAPRHVKRAIDFMRANLSQPISITEIAKACHVSERSLQQGFKDFKMTTPMAYLQHLRLEGAHGELQDAMPGLTVTAIALKWGFTNLGRFATDYKRRFGQTPSQTLRSR